MSKKSSQDQSWEILGEECIKLVTNLKVNSVLKTEWFLVWEISQFKISNLRYNKPISLHQTLPSSVMLKPEIIHQFGTEPPYLVTKVSQSETIASFKIESTSPEMLILEIKSSLVLTLSYKDQTSKAEPLSLWALLSNTLLSKKEDSSLQAPLLRITLSLRKVKFGQATQPDFWELCLHWKDK